ncbi:MAG: efflux transporter outer membrane subunit [Betaproteobacteria bacterium]|nr:efflux transporter outer membrane subunit [Betaproteobacteria bacterium]
MRVKKLPHDQGNAFTGRWTFSPAGACASLALLLALGGCAVGPDFREPDPPAAGRYTAGATPESTVSAAPGKEAAQPGAAAQKFIPAAEAPAQWWTLFESPALDTLVADALANSPSLEEASARLRQAEEILNAERGAREAPAIDAGAGISRLQPTPAALGLPEDLIELKPFTLYNVSVNVSYTFDLFGANRRQLESLAAQTAYRRFELEGARLTLAANIVTAALRHAEARARIVIAENLLRAQERQRDIVETRQAAGGASLLDLRRQRLLVAQTAASLPPLYQERERLTHQLAIYLGQPPATAEEGAEANTLSRRLDAIRLEDLHLPAELPLTLPSALARQRPDIRAAEELWHQASAEVGVATARLFPNITLSGNLGSERTRSGDIASGINVWSIGLNLMQPIFHGGELQARKRSAVAAHEAAAAVYRQTVLHGLQEVADSLRALENDALALRARNEALEEARSSWQVAEQRYHAGGISQLDLLDAERQRLQSELDRITALSGRYLDTAALLQSLGGGWWNTPENTGTPDTLE